MDLLNAANYIEELEKQENAKRTRVENVPPKVLGDVTNRTHILPKFKSLLHGQICRSVTPEPFLTPQKKRRISVGKENGVPSPRTPKYRGKLLYKESDSPPTPLSNLKLLTKIASTQTRLESEESCQTSFQSISTSQSLFQCGSLVLDDENTMKKYFSPIDSIQEIKGVDADPLKKHVAIGSENYDHRQAHFPEPSRKEKSLGVLVDRFLYHFPLEISCMQTPRNIAIDDVASILSTERRRVYDIINILESLNMAERVHKNAYQWRGKQLLENTLSRLKRLAVQWGVQSDQGAALFYPNDLQNEGSSEGVIARKSKSLGVLCQKFMMLLLVSPPPHIVHLDAAISFLLGHHSDSSSQNKTKGRRIYDIANVLMSLKLVKRLPQSKSFQYIGPAVLASKEMEDIYSIQSRTRHSLLSPSEAILSDGKGISQGPSRLGPEITPTSSVFSYAKKREVQNSEPAPKAKRNCLVMSAPSRAVPKSTALLAKRTRQEFPFKIPPVDAQSLKGKRLFEPCTTQIVTASKAKSITYIYPNMKNLDQSKTRVALTFDHEKQQSCNISPAIVRKPQFCLQSNYATGNNHNVERVTPIGNGLKAKRISAPTSHPPVQASCSNSSLQPPVRAKPLTPVLQQSKRISLPSISLNTLSRNHYKTVIGTVPSQSKTSNTDTPLRFVIRNNSTTKYGMPGSNEFIRVVHHINETEE